MALFHKSAGKFVVPWFCSAEWNLVFKKIYGASHCQQTRLEALEILNIWKARTPELPRGVEGTFIILEALLCDRGRYETYNLQLLFSTSIMRFLNICAAYDKIQGTFFKTASKMKLPEWLITMRHEIAHGQTLPSIDFLNRALTYCLDWLYKEYWVPAVSDTRDFVDNTEIRTDRYKILKNTLQPFLSIYCYVILVKHPNWNYSYVSNIVDEDTKNDFLNALIYLTKSDNLDQNVSFSTIQKILWQNISLILNDFEDLEYIHNILPELLIEEGIFLGDIDECNEIFQDTTVLPTDFMYLWEKLLISLERLNMIESLIEKLLYLLTDAAQSPKRKKIASLWLLEIGKGFNRCSFAQNLKKEFIAKDENKLQIKLKLEEILSEKYKNANVLNFNYNISFPEVITNIEKFKTLFLEKPNEYTKVFISEFLDLNDLFKNENNKKQILDLINIYISEGHEDKIPIKIHTIEELKNVPIEIEGDDKNLNDKTYLKNSYHINNLNPQKRWWKCTSAISEYNFEQCPIGILPWQDTSMNPLL